MKSKGPFLSFTTPKLQPPELAALPKDLGIVPSTTWKKRIDSLKLFSDSLSLSLCVSLINKCKKKFKKKTESISSVFKVSANL